MARLFLWEIIEFALIVAAIHAKNTDIIIIVHIVNSGFNMENLMLTKHERHARLVKIVRREYQTEHLGSRLFPNTSGVAWQGNAVNGVDKVELHHPRPIYFGIPEPDRKNGELKSGGSDLLGCTVVWGNIAFKTQEIPILTGIEIKTGKARLKKNQKIFRDWLLSVNGIYFLARECTCWENWIPIRINGKIATWEIPDCPECGGKGFKYEDGLK